MSAFEFLLIFLTILLGLAATDICISLNRLLDAGSRVRWDWLAPLAAAVALLKIVTQWWQWFTVGPRATAVTFDMFLLLVVGGMLLFLMAAAALPDRADEPLVDLRAHYARVSRRYWLLFSTQYLVVNLFALWLTLRVHEATLGWRMLTIFILPVATLFLVFIRNRLFHTVCLVAFLALYLGQWAERGLGQ